MIRIKYKRTLSNKLTFVSGLCLIMLPLYPSNKLMDYFKIYGINIFYILLVMAIALYLLNNLKDNLKIRKDQLLGLGLFVITLYHACYGRNLDRSFYLKDLTLYFSIFFIYWSFSIFFIKNTVDIYELLDYIFSGVTICCTINIMMYVTRSLSFWGVQFYAGGRFGGNYLTPACITVPYAIYLLYTKKKRFSNLTLLFSVIVSLISLILAQSRLLFIMTILGIFLTLIIGLKDNSNRVIKLNRIVSFKISILIAVVTIVIFLCGDAKILERIASFSDLKSDTSFLVRIKLYSENFKIFINNVFGTGLGSIYPIYDANGNLFQYLNFVDNSFITIGEKLGIFALIIYINLIVIRPNRFFYRYYVKKRERIYLLMLIYYIGFLFLTTCFSAQSIVGISTATVTWIIAAYCTVNNKKYS